MKIGKSCSEKNRMFEANQRKCYEELDVKEASSEEGQTMKKLNCFGVSFGVKS